MEFFEPRIVELLTQIASEYSLSFDDLLTRYSTKSKKKEPKTKKVSSKKKKKTQPVHTHKPLEVPTVPCPLCMSHGDILALTSMKFVSV